MRRFLVIAALLIGQIWLTACGTGTHGGPGPATRTHGAAGEVGGRVNSRIDVYAHDRAGMLSPVVRGFPPLVYVPNSESDTVDVIDPKTYRIVEHFRVGARPQHIVPSWDLRTLWVNDNDGNDLVPIDPRTGKPGKPVHVADPYNLYFTPDGRSAIVMAERLHQIDFRDPRTMRLRYALHVPCRGVNHADFSADGSFFVASCEFSGQLLKVDPRRHKVLGVMDLPGHAMPQDVRLSPDGKLFYVADMAANGVWLIDAHSFRRVGFLSTGKGAHGIYFSRDSRDAYVSNRGEGSISVVDVATRTVRAKWWLPGGGSPDMGGVSADGTVLWLSGRYNGVVYAISTKNGHLIREIRVGAGPHGVCVYPQPGRYSLGHTGNMR